MFCQTKFVGLLRLKKKPVCLGFFFFGLGTVIGFYALFCIYGICVITSVSLFCANKLQLAEGINAAHAS